MLIKHHKYTWVGKWERATKYFPSGICFPRLPNRTQYDLQWLFQNPDHPMFTLNDSGSRKVQKIGVKSTEWAWSMQSLTKILVSTIEYKILKQPKMYIIFEKQGYQISHSWEFLAIYAKTCFADFQRFPTEVHIWERSIFVSCSQGVLFDRG